MASASIRRILLLLPCFIIIIHFDLSAAQSPAGFLSIDCGSAQTTNYTDDLGIGWVPDATIWPDIHGWSSTSEVTPPTDDTSGGAKYQTLRYFPPIDNTSPLNQTKFCYTLPAIGDVYYLIRATFWYGTSSTTSLYSTRVPGSISFRVMVDTYTGAQITITLPQSSPRTEEMYVRAQSESSSISVCFSAASENSDTPFINALELRPLSSQMTSVSIVNLTNTALRTALRTDYGASADAPSIIRYPNDTLDRIWETNKFGPTNQTSHSVIVAGLADSPPVPVLQTSYAAPTAAGFFVNLTAGLDTTTSYNYYLALFFAEIDPRVNASGLRVFDVTINGSPFFQDFDVYAKVGLYTAFELYSSKQLGPYTNHLLINATPTATSVYPPFISAAEILQLFDNPMVPPTSSVDILGVQGIISALSSNLSRFTGDPCLPADYKYPWLTCTDKGILPTRVTSISLSNSNLVGNVPSSISNLDQVVQILLDGNALEGPLPVDLSNLVNLQVLNLSNNKLSGPIPDSLANLPKLMYLDLQNNNFSGEIPISLQQKTGLTFKYDGNSFLCLSSNKTCAVSTTTSSTSNSSLPVIIGSVVGVIVLCIVIFMVIMCIVCKRRQSRHHENEASAIPASPRPLLGPQVVSQTKIFEAANVSQAFSFQEIVTATQNFSTIIGKGGFGFVYKGVLANGVPVAVKVLSDASQQGAHEFLNEVTLLSRVHHKKLVGLVGYCTEKKLVLVYEFMSNGSLFDSLFGNSALMDSRPLEWIERLRILLDAAQGLAYLHHGCNSLIIHRDVKSSNILMSKDLEGKMSDFGISRLKPNTGAHEELATKLMGSMGYLDPEFASTLILSEKIDIYSFGVVLFEAICGQPPVLKDRERSNNDIHIIEWARPYYNQGAIEEVVDQNMGNYNISSIWKVAEIAMACVQFEGRTRPTMNEVCNELSEALRLETSSQTISPAVTGECYPLNDVKAR